MASYGLAAPLSRGGQPGAAVVRLGLDADVLARGPGATPWRDAPAGMAQWLLARRSRSHPDELAYSFVCGPATSSLEQIVQVAGTRWQVEQAFELAKQEVGLDEYEVRHWTGW